jgi:hypothetical protein
MRFEISHRPSATSQKSLKLKARAAPNQSPRGTSSNHDGLGVWGRLGRRVERAWTRKLADPRHGGDLGLPCRGRKFRGRMSSVMRGRKGIVLTIVGFVLEERPNSQTPLGERRSSWNHWRLSGKANSFNHFK